MSNFEFITHTHSQNRKILSFFNLDAWSQLDYESMYAGIVAMGLLGVVLYEGVEVLDRTLCRWNKI